MRAHCLLREQPWYRREAFVRGLRAAGHEVLLSPPTSISPETLLLIWNRYASNHDLALRVEKGGGKVLVAENGYLGAGGSVPKFDVHPGGPQPHHFYSVTLRYHNDETCIPLASAERFAALGVELKPWRESGEHILICPNRSFGIPGRTMPPDWAEATAAKLRKQTSRPIRIRAHPGNNAPKRSIAADLEGAWAVVVWSSSCGVHALAAGIPVLVAAPFWIMRGASLSGAIDAPALPDRLPFFERLACAQWTCEEISNGEPFRHLLPASGQGEVAPHP